MAGTELKGEAIRPYHAAEKLTWLRTGRRRAEGAGQRRTTARVGGTGKAWRLLAAASRELGALVCFLHNLQEGEKGREMATGVAAASVCLLAERSDLFLRSMDEERTEEDQGERGSVRAAREERQEGKIERRWRGGMLLVVVLVWWSRRATRRELRCRQREES